MWLFPSHCLDFCFMPQHTAVGCLCCCCYCCASSSLQPTSAHILLCSLLSFFALSASFPFNADVLLHISTLNTTKISNNTNQPTRTHQKPNPSRNNTLESFFPSHNVVVLETSDFCANAFRFSFAYHFVFFVFCFINIGLRIYRNSSLTCIVGFINFQAHKIIWHTSLGRSLTLRFPLKVMNKLKTALKKRWKLGKSFCWQQSKQILIGRMKTCQKNQRTFGRSFDGKHIFCSLQISH